MMTSPHNFNKCAIPKKLKKTSKKIWKLENWYYLCNNKKRTEMTTINSNYFQKWYNTVDDVLKDKAFNIIEKYRAQMLNSIQKTYQKGKKKVADDLRKALEDVPPIFGTTISDKMAEKLDVLLDVYDYGDNPSIFPLDNSKELYDIYWDMQRELHALLEFDVKKIIDLYNSDKDIAGEIIEAVSELSELIDTTEDPQQILTDINDELWELEKTCEGCPKEYDADTFRFYDLLLNLPKHIADEDCRDYEALLESWRDITNKLKRVIENLYK